MLNYLGPNMGPQGPVTNQLPPVSPGTMPDGVPGHPAPAPAPLPAIHPSGPAASPAALAGIIPQMPGGAGAPPPPPPPPEYATTTQEDGSILLHVKNPDGTLGPIVKIIPAIKRPGDSQMQNQRPA